MVASRINPSVHYPESKTIDPEDIGHSTNVYAFDIFSGETITVVLGKPKYTFTEKNVIYFPIYAIAKDVIRSQIGVFEVEPAKITNLFKNGEIDVSRLSFPILYSFAKEPYVKKLGALLSAYDVPPVVPDAPAEPAEPASVVKDSDRLFKVNVPTKQVSPEKRDAETTLETGIFVVDKNHPTWNSLSEETEPIADELRKEFRVSSKNTWIEKYMENNHYRLIQVAGDGDCYFTSVMRAFEQIGRKTTVQKMRAILSNEVNDQLFQGLREFYLRYDTEVKRIQRKMTSIQSTLNALKKQTAQMAEKDPEHIQRAKQYVEQFNELKKERTMAERNRDTDIGYMKDIDTIDKYRAYVRTQSFWADEWAISTLERVLNYKTILLSKEAFDEGYTDNVLKCGEANEALVQRGSFTPEFYIMVSYTGNHYDLITYKERGILKFTEIPYDVKMLIINKCLEKNSGIYYLIQDFRNFKSRFGLDANEGSPADYSDAEGNGDLYDDKYQFVIHSRASGNKVKPGKADGEKTPKEPTIFTELMQIPDWRQKLDDQWATDRIKIRGRTWTSAFHYTEACKFRISHPDIYEQFSIESSNPTAMSVALAKSHKELIIPSTGKRKTVKPDVDYVLGRDVEERDMALRAKFIDNVDMKHVLLSTKQAMLLRKIHYGEPAEPDMLLMRIRKELQLSR